jgi:hypothetical protein
MKTKIAVVFGLLVLAFAALGFAQTEIKIHANIPFPFTIEGKNLPEGEYDFVRGNDDQMIQVLSPKRGSSVVAVVITRLGGWPSTKAKEEARLVFDKVGGAYYFSELWIPEMDGFLLYATKQKHEHRKISVTS